MQASTEVTSNWLIVTSSCSRPCTDLLSGIGLGVARILGVRLPERAVPFVRSIRSSSKNCASLPHAMLFVGRAGGRGISRDLGGRMPRLQWSLALHQRVEFVRFTPLATSADAAPKPNGVARDSRPIG